MITFTFYSYKGGVGRSMALVNVAELLRSAGLDVVMVDWDLEAPGLEMYFEHIRRECDQHEGIIEMLLDCKEKMSVGTPWEEDQAPPFRPIEDFLVEVYPQEGKEGFLWLLPPGRRDGEHFPRYAQRVQEFDWLDFLANWAGEAYYEWLRQQFQDVVRADVVLIDSRTGVTEMGGVCTYQLADVVVLFCASNDQSLEGTLWMARSLSHPEVEERRGRPVKLLIVPSRIENREELRDYNAFMNDFERGCKGFVPKELSATGSVADTFRRLLIPYITLYSYREKIAVRVRGLERSEELTEAYRRLVGAMAWLAPESQGWLKLRSLFRETPTLSLIPSGKAVETVLIPAGDFWMGSDLYDREALDNEKPQHKVTLPTYEIAKYPVTNAQYRAFVQATGHLAPAHWSEGHVPAGKGNHPVVNVSLEDARAFCRWLTKATGWLHRLPTEQEWEKAARGAYPDRRRYPWGDEGVDDTANTKEAGYHDTTPVDAFEEKNQSPFGVVDMVGNVLEWTESIYESYPSSTYQTEVGGVRYVVRGGCYTLPWYGARVSSRGRYRFGEVRPYLGFRVVVEVE